MIDEAVGSAEDRAYFEGQIASTEEWWRRFGRKPDLAGKRVLDLGCGHGALSLDVARGGADVLGVDLEPKLVAFAQAAGAQSDVADRVRFELVRLEELDEDAGFDIALSKDTFEHVIELEAMGRALFRVLKPGGELWAGFSPLYASPWGDHGRTGLRVPWAHALLPRRTVLRAASRHNGRRVNTLGDIGLNGITSADFWRAMTAAGFEVDSVAYNQGDKPLMGALARARRFRALEKWATVGIYAVLRRPAD